MTEKTGTLVLRYFRSFVSHAEMHKCDNDNRCQYARLDYADLDDTRPVGWLIISDVFGGKKWYCPQCAELHTSADKRD